MKEGENMKLIKRITAYLLTFSILLSIGSSVVAAAVAPVEQEYPAHEDPSQEMLTDLEQKGVQINHVKDSSLITNIKNPSNGKLSFTIKIPANQTLYYKVELIPSKRAGAIETPKNASYYNSSNRTVTKTITVDVKHFSPNYVITANYTTGNSRIKTVYEDEEKVASKLVKQITSKPFVWTQAELDKYNAGKTISWAVTFATLEFVSIEIGALLKGAETIGTALNIGWSFIGDGGVPSTESPTQYELDMVPRLGLKYQVSYIPTNSGISRKILVTLPDGRSSTYSFGTYQSGITIRIPT